MVLKDSIWGTTTIAVSQAILIDGTPVPSSTVSDHDQFLATVDDNGAAWAVHFEANNGDLLVFLLPLINEAGPNEDILAEITLDIPACITVDIREDQNGEGGFTSTTLDIPDVVSLNHYTWRFEVDGDTDDAPGGDRDGLIFYIALEDDCPAGFYTLGGVIMPVPVYRGPTTPFIPGDPNEEPSIQSPANPAPPSHTQPPKEPETIQPGEVSIPRPSNEDDVKNTIIVGGSDSGSGSYFGGGTGTIGYGQSDPGTYSGSYYGAPAQHPDATPGYYSSGGFEGILCC